MKDSKQPSRASKDASSAKRQPASDMNARAAGGDKESNEPLRRQQKSSGPASTPPRKPSR
jgi:hypothetical protein